MTIVSRSRIEIKIRDPEIDSYMIVLEPDSNAEDEDDKEDEIPVRLFVILLHEIIYMPAR